MKEPPVRLSITHAWPPGRSVFTSTSASQLSMKLQGIARGGQGLAATRKGREAGAGAKRLQVRQVLVAGGAGTAQFALAGRQA
jgi:hypothetical protein